MASAQMMMTKRLAKKAKAPRTKRKALGNVTSRPAHRTGKPRGLRKALY